jgi:Mn2+/Fe2+ NRAMP family transporter
LIVVGSFSAIARAFKIVCATLLAYVVVMCTSKVPWRLVAIHTIVPQVEITKQYMLLLVAVLGTRSRPYLFFWRSAHRIEELRDEPEGGDEPLAITDRPLHQAVAKQRTSRADVFAGMAFSTSS